MKEKKAKTGPPDKKKPEKEGNNVNEGYPLYPEEEDIYKQYLEEKNIDPEDISRKKEINAEEEREESIDDVLKTGNDLDVPGAELDDEQEEIGNEDEENNYYSLGGDEHNNLDEDNDV